MSDTVLVTGGAGFIGSHLVEALAHEGYKVRVLDSLVKGRLSSIQYLMDEGRMEFIEGDIRDRDIVDKATRGVSCVFHTAGVHILRSLASPEEAIQVNIQGSYNVFRSALEHGVQRVVFSSSSSIYGDPKTLPMGEESPVAPVEPYGASKFMVEQLLHHLGKEGLEYNILRYFNVYGERQAAHAFYTTVINVFVKRLLASQPPVIDGSGEQSMDFTYVADVVRANILAMKAPVKNETFNVGTGVSTSVRDLAAMLIEALNARVEPTFRERRSLVSRRQADTRKAAALLGFQAQVPVQEGVRRVALAIAAHPEWY
ncbi:MAG: SDR family NAD(P)-dependent oxidoreductase [Chloroflexi bacterium]|nr:SDR family NAD(P)-dependent oxidoreductase [Chloroflexota bacterium]